MERLDAQATVIWVAQLKQPDQPLVIKLGQPGAQGYALSSFGHC